MIVYYGVPKLRDFTLSRLNQWMTEAKATAAIEGAWAPPAADLDAAAWFPPSITTHSLQAPDAPNTGIPELELELAGRQATYVDGPRKVEIFVCKASQLEKEGFFQRLENAGNKGGNYLRQTSGNSVYEERTGMPHLSVQWRKGWLFIFRGDEDPRDFSKAYLTAISATPPLERPIEKPIGTNADPL